MTDENGTTGTFLVTAADEASAVLTDVAGGQVHTLASNPGLEEGEAVAGTVVPEPPLETVWTLTEVTEQWPIRIEESDESPTGLARELAAAQDVGDLTRRERAGTGELHVLTVPEAETEAAVADVLDDETGLHTRAARLGVARVVVRSSPGVVCVRYLP